MKEIRESLFKLECCSANLKDQNNLIDLLINNGFDKSEIDLLEWRLEFKRNQSLLFTISKELLEIEKILQTSIEDIYKYLKENKGVDNGKKKDV